MTNKREKNLTLRDIHVGDWVQCWLLIPQEYTCPMKITQINYDGTILLVPSDEEICTPYEFNITEVDGLPITGKLLKGFGFKLTQKFPEGNELHEYDGKQFLFFGRALGRLLFTFKTDSYFHNLQQRYNLEGLQWQGIEKEGGEK